MRVAALVLSLALAGHAAAATVTCPSLAPGDVTTVPKNVTCLATGHINNDGRNDVAVGTDGNEVVLHKRNPDLTFTPFPIALPGRPVAVAMGDFDGNNVADVAVVHSSSLVSILLLESDFTQIGGSTLRADDNPVAITAADLTGDSKLDLVVANMFSSNVSVFVGDGAGGFTLKGTYPAGTAPAGVAAADFDGDGDRDVVVANFTTSGISLLEGDGTGRLDVAPPQPIPAGTDPSAIAAGDFNNDGVPDIATANFGSANVSVILGLRTAGEYTPLPAVNYPAGRAPVAITAAQFDVGSNLDLIVSNGASATVAVLAGVGDGTFAAGNSQPVEGLPWGTASGQFDESFVKGIAAAHLSAPSFSVFTSNCPQPPTLKDFTPKVGLISGGQIVKLTGYYLGDTIKVEFGTETATIVSKSGSVVTVLAPPRLDAVPVTVKVTTSSGFHSKDYYAYMNPLTVHGSPFNGSRGGYQYVLLDAGTPPSIFTPKFKDIIREVRFGSSVPALITYDQVPFPLPPQWRSDGMQVFIRTPPSPNGALGPIDVTVVTDAGSVLTDTQYVYTNNTPDALPGAITTSEDTPVNLVLVAEDPDIGDVLSSAIATPPTKGKLSPPFKTDPFAKQWQLVYTPNPNATGSDSFSFTSSDGTNTSAPDTVSITITPVNDPPAGKSQLLTITEETATGVTLTGTDVDTSPLTSFAVTSQPSKGTLTGTAPNLTYTPSANAYGSDSFTFTVSDGQLVSAPAKVSIEITNVNDAPAATPQARTVAEDTPLDVTLDGTDVDGDGLGFEITTPPTKGVLLGAGPTRIYKPNLNVFGTDTFSFRVNDGTVSSAPATVTIDITPVNDAPVASAQAVTLDVSTSANIVLTGSDVESSPLTFAVAVPPGRGTLEGAPPNVKYTPLPGYIGADSFSFTVNDGALTSVPATVALTVDGPQVTALRTTVNENAGKAEVLLRLSRTLTLPVSLKFTTEDNSANAPADYLKSTGTVTFAAGQTEKIVGISIVDDAISEPPETFTLELSSFANATTKSPRVSVRIDDDDPLPLVSVSNVAQVEGDAGTSSFDFVLTLSGDTALTVVVKCATEDGTALASSDYKTRADVVTFNPGEKVKTFSVLVNGDTLLEPTETFRLVLSPVLNATTGPPGTAVILTDDSSRRRAAPH